MNREPMATPRRTSLPCPAIRTRATRKAVVLACLLVLSCFGTVGDGPGFPNFGVTAANAQTGIWTPFIPPGSTVFDVAPAAGGRILIATRFAPYVYDGLRLARVPIGSPDFDSLSGKCVLETRSGDVWFGTLSHGLFVLRPDGTTTRYTAASGLGNSSIDRVLALAEDTDGRIWAATDGGGLSVFDGLQWTTLTTDQGLTSPVISALAIDPGDGSIWAGLLGSGGSNGGLAHIQGSSVTVYSNLPSTNRNVYALAFAQSGDLWVGTEDGLARFSAGAFEAIPIGSAVLAVDAGVHGEMWFGTGARGVGRMSTGSFVILPGGPVSSAVRDVHVDPAGTLWVGTVGGLSRFEGGSWLNYSANDLLPTSFLGRACARDLSAAARGDSIDAQGIAWFGSRPMPPVGQKLVRRANGRLSFLGPADGLPGGTVNALETDGLGGLWLGTISDLAGGGLAHLRVDGSVERILRIADGLPSNEVTSLQLDGVNLWVGTVSGVARWDGTAVRTLPSGPSAVPDAPIRGLDLDPDGRIWIVTGTSPSNPDPRPAGGAVRFDPADSSYLHVGITQGLPTNDLTSVRVASNGDVWFGSRAGAIRYRDGVLRTFGLSDGLASEFVNSVAEGQAGRIWLGTDGGAAVFDERNWSNFAPGDGLAGSIVYHVFADSMGLLLSCLGDGVSLFHPDETPPRPEITNGPPPAVGAREVQFGVRGGDLDGGQRGLTLSYQIDSQTPAPFVEDLVAINATLPDGDHVVRLWAKDRGLNVSPTPFAWPFTVDATPPRPIVSEPAFNDVVRDTVDVVGIVSDPRFASYLIELRPQGRVAWDTVLVAPAPPVPGEPLYRWDTTQGQDGPWELRVGSLDSLGLVGYVQVTVIVDNLAPSANVTSPARVDHVQGGRVFTTQGEVELYVPPNAWPSDQTVRIDSLAVADTLRARGWLKIWKLEASLPDLTKPATLTVQVPGTPGAPPLAAGTPVTLERVNPDQTLTAVGGAKSADGSSLSTSIQSLGTFALIVGDEIAGAGFEGVRSLDCQPRVLSPNGGGFDTQTAISFELGRAGTGAVKVFDRAGRLVREIVESAPFAPGRNVVTWDGKNRDGEVVPSGLYVVAVRFDGETSVKTVVVANR